MVNRVVSSDRLDQETMRFARRLALIGPEALCSAELAVNRGADAAGFQTAMNVGLEVVAPLYAATTEDRTRFREISEKESVAAAVEWRTAQFGRP